MKCYLHIGTEKTATTTIQNFLDVNRKQLYEDGCIYTRSGGVSNNRALAVAAYNLDRRDDFTKQRGLNSNESLLKFQQKIIADLGNEISELAHNTSKIVFSSEHFQSRLTQIDEIQRLRDILYGFGVNQVFVVVYLRRPAEIANSLYSTAIKAGGVLRRPPPPSRPYWNNICNHKSTLEKFSSVFGESAVTPRIFNPKEFKNGSIIDDFLGVVGIEGGGAYSIPENANESLSINGIYLLTCLNRTVPRWIGDKPNPLRADLVSYFQKHFSDSKYVMPEELFEEYDAAFKDSNEWVRAKYFPDRCALFSEGVPKERRGVEGEVDLDRIASFIANIWNDKQKKILSSSSKNVA